VSEEESVPDWVTSGQPDEQDEFSKLDADGDGVITREEYEAGMSNGPMLTGDVSTSQEQGSPVSGIEGHGPPPAKRINKHGEFVLGLVGAPIALTIMAALLGGLVEGATGDYGAGGFVRVGTFGIGAIGGAVWGFTTGHQSFAWGLLTGLVLIPVLLVALLFGFCLVMISGGGKL